MVRIASKYICKCIPSYLSPKDSSTPEVQFWQQIPKKDTLGKVLLNGFCLYSHKKYGVVHNIQHLLKYDVLAGKQYACLTKCFGKKIN